MDYVVIVFCVAMFFIIKKRIKNIKIQKENKKLEAEYPFLILSPRVPMEEELGITKEEVLINYNKYILGELVEEIKKLGFKQRGKTQDYYKILENGFVVNINIHRSIKSFSIFNVVCGCIPLFIYKGRYQYAYHLSLTKFAGLSQLDFDCQNGFAAKQSKNFIINTIKHKILPWIDDLNNFECINHLLKINKDFGNWDIILALLLREGRLEEASQEISNIKKDSFYKGNQSAYDEYIKEKLVYYENLMAKGKEACIENVRLIELNNMKKFKISEF